MTKFNGTLVRIEPNGFGVVKLDRADTVVGVFSGRDRSPKNKPSSFKPDVRVTADAGEKIGRIQYLTNVVVDAS